MKPVEVSLSIAEAGACRHPRFMVEAGGGLERPRFPARFATIVHPIHGVILFDTGYSRRFFDETRDLSGRVYRALTPVELEHGSPAVHHLASLGIEPSSVRRVIISHFHPDHIGAIRDFPNATLIAVREAWEHVSSLHGIRRRLSGFLPALLPPDFEDRAQLIDLEAFRSSSPDTLFPSFDLFGDGSVELALLPGHARGQLGAMVRSKGRTTFLVADAAWTCRSFQSRLPPHVLARVIFDDPMASRTTLERLFLLSRSAPDLDIVTSHCPDCGPAKGRWTCALPAIDARGIG